MTPAGFPHSEIRGSKGDCPSPRLIAAFHVLRRLPVPRHPPCALGILLANKGVRRNEFLLGTISFKTYVLRSYRPCREPPSLICMSHWLMIHDHVDVSRHQFRTDAARYADVKVPGAGALGTGCWRLCRGRGHRFKFCLVSPGRGASARPSRTPFSTSP